MSETSTEEELKMDFPMVPEFVGTGAADENVQERTEFLKDGLALDRLQ